MTTHGDVIALRMCVDTIVEVGKAAVAIVCCPLSRMQKWDFERIVAAHGSQPFTMFENESAKDAFKRCWYDIPLQAAVSL